MTMTRPLLTSFQIRDRLGKDAAHTILLARFFLTCIRDRVDHPLSHPLM